MFFQRDDALNDARAIAKNREEQLAGFAHVVKPAANRDGLSGEFAGLLDSDDWRCGRSVGLRLLVIRSSV